MKSLTLMLPFLAFASGIPPVPSEIELLNWKILNLPRQNFGGNELDVARGEYSRRERAILETEIFKEKNQKSQEDTEQLVRNHLHVASKMIPSKFHRSLIEDSTNFLWSCSNFSIELVFRN